MKMEVKFKRIYEKPIANWGKISSALIRKGRILIFHECRLEESTHKHSY